MGRRLKSLKLLNYEIKIDGVDTNSKTANPVFISYFDQLI